MCTSNKGKTVGMSEWTFLLYTLFGAQSWFKNKKLCFGRLIHLVQSYAALVYSSLVFNFGVFFGGTGKSYIWTDHDDSDAPLSIWDNGHRLINRLAVVVWQLVFVHSTVTAVDIVTQLTAVWEDAKFLFIWTIYFQRSSVSLWPVWF